MSAKILQLHPITQRCIAPLQSTALDEYAALLARIEDFVADETRLEKELRLVRTRKEELWLRADQINAGRIK